MKLRCGKCRMTFEAVAGAATMPCPACGTANRVPGAPSPQPPPVVRVHQRTRCPACNFAFIVGTVDVAVCPNCRSEVEVG